MCERLMKVMQLDGGAARRLPSVGPLGEPARLLACPNDLRSPLHDARVIYARCEAFSGLHS